MEAIEDAISVIKARSYNTMWGHDGREISVIEFEDKSDLLTAFTMLIGNPVMKGHSSKAIGSTLLIWKR